MGHVGEGRGALLAERHVDGVPHVSRCEVGNAGARPKRSVRGVWRVKRTGARVWSVGHVSGTLGAWLGRWARVVVAMMAVLPRGRAEAVWVGSCSMVVSGGRPRHCCDSHDVSLTAPSVARGSVAGLVCAGRVVWDVWHAWGAWGACQVSSYGVGGGMSSVAWVQFIVVQQGWWGS